jgi:hypothetical protein
MSAAKAPEPVEPTGGSEAIRVEGLLVCRSVEGTVSGGVTVRDVLDIVALPSFPGDAGPLSFVAFVRATRPGEANVSFRVHPIADESVTIANLPGRLTVSAGYEGRQTAIHTGFKSLTVKHGGWFGVEFRVGERVLARSRFAIGARGGASSNPSAPATS